MAAVEYDLQEYNDAPDYQWQDSYDADNFAQDIDQYNDLFFRHLRRAVCHRIDPLLDPRVGGCTSVPEAHPPARQLGD